MLIGEKAGVSNPFPSTLLYIYADTNVQTNLSIMLYVYNEVVTSSTVVDAENDQNTDAQSSVHSVVSNAHRNCFSLDSF